MSLFYNLNLMLSKINSMFLSFNARNFMCREDLASQLNCPVFDYILMKFIEVARR
jgi:hypothetical protein